MPTHDASTPVCDRLPGTRLLAGEADQLLDRCAHVMTVRCARCVRSRGARLYKARDWRERRAPIAAVQRDVRPVDGTTSLGR